MNPKKPVSNVDIPDIEKCPNCGQNIFLGETECSRCGYDVSNWQQKLQQFNPQVVAGLLFLVGVLITLSGLSADNTVRAILVLLGMGLIVSGGLVMTAEYFLEDIIRLIKHRLKKK